MSAQHTPGPWFIKPAAEATTADGQHLQWMEYRVSAGTDDGTAKHYYRIGSVSNANDSDQNEANSRLIAAAPDLLAALQSYLRWVEAEEDHAKADFYQRIEMCRETDRMARAAIAKATGTESKVQDPQGENHG